jgi:hypothetical protein
MIVVILYLIQGVGELILNKEIERIDLDQKLLTVETRLKRGSSLIGI